MEVHTGSERRVPSQELISYCSVVTAARARRPTPLRSVRKPRALSAGTRGWSTQYTSMAESFADSRSWRTSLSCAGGTAVYATRSPGCAFSKPRMTGRNVSGVSGPRNRTVRPGSPDASEVHPVRAAPDAVAARAAASSVLRLSGRAAPGERFMATTLHRVEPREGELWPSRIQIVLHDR